MLLYFSFLGNRKMNNFKHDIQEVQYRFFRIGVSGFLGYSPNNGIAGSKGSSIFSFLKKFHTYTIHKNKLKMDKRLKYKS